MKMLRLTVAVVLLIGTSLVAAERYTLEHTARIVGVSNPRFSPDGSRIVIAVSRANLQENRFDTELVQVEVATRAQRILTRRQASQHQWSHDGTRLAFIAPIDGKAQLWVLPMDGGEAQQVTKSPTPVQGYAWRPDGRALTYWATDEAPKREGEERNNRSFEADVNYLLTEAPVSSHLWIVPASGGDATRLTSGPWSVAGGASWSPDGKRIAIDAQPGPGPRFWQEQASRVVDVDTGRVSPLSGKSGMESIAGFSPDGQHFAYGWPRDGDPRFVREIWVMPAGGGPATNLTRALDANAQASWAPDGQSLYIVTPTGTANVLWLQPLEGAARRLDTGGLQFFGLNVSKSGGLAFIGNQSGHPDELYYKATPFSPPRRLTDFNAHIAALELGRQEPLQWKGGDGFDVDGVVTYPPGYQPGKPYPLVLVVHGGPRGASMISFSARAQWLASQGWVIFEPNYRGSSNGGNAFQAAIWNDAGAGPGRDVMAGVDLLIKKGIADPSRMAVSGWSYGGYMTTWLLGNYPDRWRAGVAGASVTDHIDQYAFSDIHAAVATYYGGSPFTDPKRLQAYRDQAPITYASKIKAPTLVLHDTGDQRVPVTESFLLHHVLRDNGVETKFIAYPVSGHFPGDPIHQRDIDRRWADWIRQHFAAPAGSR
jgi:dipeptidyl aminopeptidase/acylaminoacyl peptidase